jgi:hypothetical protein
MKYTCFHLVPRRLPPPFHPPYYPLLCLEEHAKCDNLYFHVIEGLCKHKFGFCRDATRRAMRHIMLHLQRDRANGRVDKLLEISNTGSRGAAIFPYLLVLPLNLTRCGKQSGDRHHST